MIELPIVLDASATMTWFFPDEATAKSEALRTRVAQSGAVVPEIWPTEVEASIRLGEQRGWADEAAAALFIRFIRGQPISVDRRQLDSTFGDLLPISRQHGLTPYDASYIELALRRGLPLATLDARMEDAAKRMGIELFDLS